MKRLVMMGMTAAMAMTASADRMPNATDIKKAKPLIVELMKDDLSALKAKKKTLADVADIAVKYAAEAQTSAAKLMLLRSAVQYYVRGEKYDQAADTVERLKTEFEDIRPRDVADIIGNATKYATKKKAPRLFAMWQTATRQMKADEEAKSLEAELKARPTKDARRRYAEALAVCGDWKKALGQFVQLKGDGAKLAKEELDGKAKNAALGEYWWSYTPITADYGTVFQAHAAVFYRRAIAAGEIAGLQKTLIEKRIADFPAEQDATAASPVSGNVAAADSADSFTGKGSFQVKGNAAWLVLPNGEKINFVKCPKGRFNMLYHYTGDDQSFLTDMDHVFWISDRVITHAHEAGVYPEKGKNTDEYARKHAVMPNDGAIEGFMERLQNDYGTMLPSGYVFRLPSIAEFEYAYHANSKDVKDPYFYVNPTKEMIWRITTLNRGPGENEPNAWGIHDMICYQRFLDRIDPACWSICDTPSGDKKPMIREFLGKKSNKAPFFWSDNEDSYVMSIYHCNFKDRNAAVRGHSYHFHLVIGPDLVSEWKAKHAGGAKPSVTAAANENSSVSAPSGKAWQEKGNTAWLNLGKRGKIEFVKCPPGDVKMVMDRNAGTARVKISRPFWIMKEPFKWNQMAAVPGIPCGDKDGVAHANWNMDDIAAKWMTGEFQDEIPKGYVFRLPSLAELEYAFHANTKNRKDPYYDLLRGHVGDEIEKARLKTPNAWGIRDFGWQRCLDTFEPGMLEGYNDCKDPNDVKAITVRADQVDNLFWSESPNRLNMQRWTNYVIWRMVKQKDKGGDWGPITRLVVGPDLVSEWKAKHGKK